MDALITLFSTDFGLMSLAVIVSVIAMMVWFYRYFLKKVNESEQAEKKAYPEGQSGKTP